jgi:hypothetical protein
VVLGVYAASQGDVVTFTEGFETYADGTVVPSPNWTATNNFPNASMFVDTDSLGVAHSGTKVYHSYRNVINTNTGGSGYITSTSLANIRYSGDDGVYVYTGWMYLGNSNTSGESIKMSSEIDFRTVDSSGNLGTVIGFQLNSPSNSPRNIKYLDGNGVHFVDLTSAIPLDTWLKVVTTIDEINDEWSFAITTESGADVYSLSDLSYNSSSFTQLDKIRVNFERRGKDDGWNNRVDDISVTYVPEPASMLLLTAGAALLLKKRR